MQYTYVMIKPDGVKRRLIGEIIRRIEQRGYAVARIETGVATRDILEKHYAHIKDKPFFPKLADFMTSGPLVKMIIAGEDVVGGVRKIIGKTDPLEAPMGSIRGDLACNVGRNLVHASDCEESAEKEMDLWMGGKPETCEIVGKDLIYEE